MYFIYCKQLYEIPIIYLKLIKLCLGHILINFKMCYINGVTVGETLVKRIWVLFYFILFYFIVSFLKLLIPAFQTVYYVIRCLLYSSLDNLLFIGIMSQYFLSYQGEAGLSGLPGREGAEVIAMHYS